MSQNTSGFVWWKGWSTGFCAAIAFTEPSEPRFFAVKTCQSQAPLGGAPCAISTELGLCDVEKQTNLARSNA